MLSGVRRLGFVIAGLSVIPVSLAADAHNKACNLFHVLCDPDVAPLIMPRTGNGTAPLGEAALQHVQMLPSRQWTEDSAFVEELVTAQEPALLKGTVVDTWRARFWTWDELEHRISDKVLENVLHSDSHLNLQPDSTSPLHPVVRHHVPHRMRNMSGADLLHHVRAEPSKFASNGSRQFVYLGAIPDDLQSDLKKDDFLYASAADADAHTQHMWISTPGLRTHTHFDSDHNIFVQLLGTKRFVLWAPNQTRHLCPFPRLHPLWHKSRADFEAPDTDLAPCANYTKSEALVVTVAPGDLLYVPPFWWHTVETLTPSLSITSWSAYHAMHWHIGAGVYKMAHFFDDLFWYDARVYSLRIYLALLLRSVLGVRPGEEPLFFNGLRSRYVGIKDQFHDHNDRDQTLCVLDERGTPTCQHCMASMKFEVSIASDHFKAMPEDLQKTLLEDYVEEISGQVVGINRVLSFWERCYDRQKIFLTQLDTREHERLWTTKVSGGDADIPLDDLE